VVVVALSFPITVSDPVCGTVKFIQFHRYCLGSEVAIEGFYHATREAHFWELIVELLALAGRNEHVILNSHRSGDFRVLINRSSRVQ
jgi:hypothetical protein